jgi:transcriptional regulator with XRE-family HTH domain
VTQRNALDPRLVGSRIRDLRGKTTQKDLAAALNVGTSAVMRWEGGKHAPDYDNAVKLAGYFDRELEFFYEPQARWASEAPVGELEAILDRLLVLTPAQQAALAPEAERLADAIRALSLKADRVADLLEALTAPHNGHELPGTSG